MSQFETLRRVKHELKTRRLHDFGNHPAAAFMKVQWVAVPLFLNTLLISLIHNLPESPKLLCLHKKACCRRLDQQTGL